MARKAKQATRGRKKRKPISPGVWILVGLTVGLGVALSVYFYDRHYLITSAALAPQAPPQSAPSEPEERSAQASAPRPTELPKPRFDFYTILPEMEVVIPESELKALEEGLAQRTKDEGKYLIQVGSFNRFADADELKANLALLGIEARIESVTVNNDETWHRVRIGPYQGLDALSKVRVRLWENRYDFMLLKVKD